MAPSAQSMLASFLKAEASQAGLPHPFGHPLDVYTPKGMQDGNSWVEGLLLLVTLAIAPAISSILGFVNSLPSKKPVCVCKTVCICVHLCDSACGCAYVHMYMHVQVCVCV